MPPARKRKARYNAARYDGPHRVMRQRLDPVVQTGAVACARCGELIEPGSKWQLDHRDDGRGWLGPSHARCNQRAGWEAMIRSQSGNGHSGYLEEPPCRWSQRWFEDPPLGTTLNAGEGKAEVYLGEGQWSQPVPRESVPYY